MRFPAILSAVGIAFLSACSTQPKEDYHPAYEAWLADGRVTMMTLQTLDTGDIQKTRRVAMTSLHVKAEALADIAAEAHPTPEEK